MAILAEQMLLSWTWIRTTSPVPFEFTFHVDFDGISLLLVACCAVSVAGILCWQLRQAPTRVFVLLCGIVLSLEFLLLSRDLLQIVLFWWLIAICGQGLLLFSLNTNQSATVVVKLRSQLITEMLGLILLVLGIAFCWMQFHTFEIATLVGLSTEKLNPAEQAILTTIGYCIIFAVLIRCAQFPFNAWIASQLSQDFNPQHSAEEQQHLEQTADMTFAFLFGIVMPGSIYLLIRFLPVLHGNVQQITTAAYFSLLSAGMCTLIAINSTSWRLVICHLGIAQMAFILIGLLSTTSEAQTAALLMLLVHILVFPTLWLCVSRAVQEQGVKQDSESSTSHGLVKPWVLPMVLSFVWLSGLWGQNTILSEITFQFVSGESETGIQQTSGFNLLPFLLTVVMFLLSFAFARISLLTVRRQSTEQLSQHVERGEWDGTSGNRLLNLFTLILIILLIAIAAGIILIPQTLETYLLQNTQFTWDIRGLMRLDIGTVAALAGLVCGWLLYHQANPWPERIGQLFSPLSRLAQNHFYVKDQVYYVFNLPVRTIALLMRFLEWVLIDQVIIKSITAVMLLITRLARPLQSGQLQLYLLSILLSVGVLMMLMLGD